MGMPFRVETLPDSKSIGHIYFGTPTQEELDIAYNQIAIECRSRLTQKYGEWDTAAQRLDTALSFMKDTKSAFHILVAKHITDLSKELHSPLSCSATGSIIDYLLGFSPVNPLPAHYYCSDCHHTEESDTTADGFDLEEKNCPVCGKPMRRDGHNCSESLCWASRQGLQRIRGLQLEVTNKVLEAAQSYLDTQLSKCQSISDTYCSITITAISPLNLLQKLSDATPTAYNDISFNDRRIWNDVIDNTITDYNSQHAPISFEINQMIDFHTTIRLLGLLKGSFVDSKDSSKLSESACFLLRDELELEIKKHDEANATVIAYSCKVPDNRNLPSELRQAIDSTNNLWTTGSCVNILLREYLQMWYKLNFPKEFERLSKEL